MVDLAIQSGVSISTQAASTCGAGSRGIRGRYTLKAGLETLLAGTGCGFRMIDARAVEIVRLPPVGAANRKPAPRQESETTFGLPELVVVATRRPTPADRLAYAVSAIDGPSV
ncbi:MAG: STN domain-containing protein, partial [bacterium]|nr:STN domain-containing protein [bacterium]